MPINGFPFREGGGLDWSPIFATIIGCVISMAMAFDNIPKTAKLLAQSLDILLREIHRSSPKQSTAAFL